MLTFLGWFNKSKVRSLGERGYLENVQRRAKACKGVQRRAKGEGTKNR